MALRLPYSLLCCGTPQWIRLVAGSDTLQGVMQTYSRLLSQWVCGSSNNNHDLWLRCQRRRDDSCGQNSAGLAVWSIDKSREMDSSDYLWRSC